MKNQAKWSKSEIKEIEGHIQGGALHAANGYQALGDSGYSDALSALQRRKLDMALLSLDILIRIQDDYVAKDRDFLAYLNSDDGQRVYPNSLPEMLARFTALKAEHEKKAAKYRKLNAKLRAHGLPEEMS